MPARDISLGIERIERSAAMICPKCGFEQPESPECMRCGVIVGRYKGAAYNATPQTPREPFPAPAAARQPPPLPSGHETVRLALAPPPAPLPAPAPFAPPPAGGTVYQGPDAGTPAAEAMRQAPSFGSLQSALRMATRRLAAGEILGETFSIYFKNIIPFSILTALAYLPIFLLGGVMTQSAKANSVSAIAFAALIGLAAWLLCMPLSTAAVTFGVFQQMRGQDASLGACLSVGLSCLLPVLSVVALEMLVLLGLFMVVLVPVFLSARFPGCSLLAIPLLLIGLVGFLLLVLRFYVAVPAAVEERPGAIGALRRSALLTQGELGPIFRVVFLLGLLDSAVTKAATSVPRAGVVLEPLASLVVIGLSATACAVVYYRLRSLKESIDVDQIASVFA
jgi:hypothetical protein